MAPTRDLRLLTSAVFATALGDFVALIALVLHVHEATGSGLAVAGVFAAAMVPVVALAPVAGLLVDRLEAVRLLMLVSLAQAAVAAGLALVDGVAAILVLSTALGVGAAISQPAEFALVPAMARGTRLVRANGWMETARYAGFTLGPVAAAVLTAGGGIKVALLVNACSFVWVAVAAALMRTRRRGGARGPCERARDGFVILGRDRSLRVVVSAATGALLFISASQTVDVFYVKDVLGAGDAAFAVVFTVWMLGMVAGATGIAPRLSGADRGRWALGALALQGGGMAAGASWAVLPALLVGFLVGGLAHGVKNVMIRTLIQERAPAEVHGRAFAAYNAVRNSAELGALGAGGVLVSVLGPQAALILAGLGPVVAGALGLLALERAPRGRTAPTDSSSRGRPRVRRLPGGQDALPVRTSL